VSTPFKPALFATAMSPDVDGGESAQSVDSSGVVEDGCDLGVGGRILAHTSATVGTDSESRWLAGCGGRASGWTTSSPTNCCKCRRLCNESGHLIQPMQPSACCHIDTCVEGLLASSAELKVMRAKVVGH